jgi:hypothetical protein
LGILKRNDRIGTALRAKVKVKAKAKFALEQVTKAQRGSSRNIALLFL